MRERTIGFRRATWARDRIAVVFTYDEELVALVKMVPGREWDRGRRVWTVPNVPEHVRWLFARLPAGVTPRIDPELAAALLQQEKAVSVAAAVRKAGDADVAWPLLTVPYAHQKAGLQFLASLGGGALLWEMGLGKTAAAIAFCETEYRKVHYLKGTQNGVATWADRIPPFRVLVICPNTVKRNWKAEVIKHTGADHALVPEGSIEQRAAQLGHWKYTVINCEAMSLAKMASAVQAIEWDVVIVDESTRFKSPNAKRTKALHKIKATHRIILTGTPITNSAEDAWAQMHFVTPGLLGSWWSFVDRYLVRNPWTKAIEGVKANMATDLAEKIGTRSYRILKSEVLDLPPKVYEDREVELSPVQRRAYTAMKEELRTVFEGNEIAAYNVLTQLLRLTQITAGMIGEGDRYTWLGVTENAKLSALDELLNEDLKGQQAVVFGIYQRELEELARRYTGEQTGILYGPTRERDRATYIEEFQRGSRQYLFAQSRTGGIGINLTAAQYAVYYTRGWSLEEYLQSQDRLHRIGQRGTVTIVHLNAKGTVDDQIAKALASKQNLADSLTGDAARRLVYEVMGD
jgi:SNF2 family DNA or RNA helicase